MGASTSVSGGNPFVTVPAGDPTVKVLSADQAQRLMSVHLDIARQGGDPAVSLVNALRAILASHAAVFEKRDEAWVARARSFAEGELPDVTGITRALDTLATVAPAVVSEQWTEAHERWTLMGCKTRAPMVIAIQGDWARSSSLLLLIARNFALLWESRRTRSRARAHLTSRRLARRLLLASGLQAVCGTLVREMATAVNARIAALAVSDPVDRHLSILATHGYPLELVEHLQIDPREGVLGTVFQSGRPLHVRRLSDTSSRRRRARYRTDSYVAMPIRAGDEVLGVICVTDRENNGAFTHDDVATLRALAAPAALALGRERAVAQAENFALTAAIDPVSGVFNRRHFHVRLEEELQRARRHQLSLAFLMIDIDNFKSVNDSFGHLAGDLVIRDVAEILRRSVRVFDVCARFGGEEFAIIMPGSVVESASIVAERIRERIEHYRPADPSLAGLHLTASIGLAVSMSGLSGREFIARADHALYLAKRDGKNRVRVHDEEPKGLEGEIDG
jgi:diguanylate cyclase (GGDEF)-like protein